MKSERRKKESERKKYKRTKAYENGGGDSLYARKCAYLDKTGLWGFEVPEPKPWR